MADQESKTAEVIQSANEELERVKRQTQLTIHEVTRMPLRALVAKLSVYRPNSSWRRFDKRDSCR